MKSLTKLTGVEINSMSEKELRSLYIQSSYKVSAGLQRMEKYQQQHKITPFVLENYREKYGTTKVDTIIAPKEWNVNKLRSEVMKNLRVIQSKTFTNTGLENAFKNYSSAFFPGESPVSAARKTRKLFRDYERDHNKSFFKALNDMLDEFGGVMDSDTIASETARIFREEDGDYADMYKRVRETMNEVYKKRVKRGVS